ncbi:MAG: signal peptidase I [Armatimonadota bacterium]|nr:signal peptidase I [Armatimonadota bacterium]
MIDALQSLWRELLGSWWVLLVLPVLVVVRWLLNSRWTGLVNMRSWFFSGGAWNAILPSPAESSLAAATGASTAVLDPCEYRRKWFLELVESALVALFLVFFVIRPFVVQAFYIPSPSMVETLEVNDRILVNKFVFRVRTPQRGDIVVFEPPRRATDKVGDDWIKRVIGQPGDRIAIRNNHLYLNGTQQDEPYVALLQRGTDGEGRDHESTGRYDYNFPDPGKLDIRPGQNAYIYPAGPDAINEQFYRTVPTQDTEPRIPKGEDDYIFFVRNDPKEGMEIVVAPGHVFVMGDNRNDSEDSHYWGYLDEKRVLGQAFAIFWPLSRVRFLSNPHSH